MTVVSSTCLPGPTCKRLVDPTNAYKSAAFEVSDQELTFGGGGYEDIIAVEKQKKKTQCQIDTDDDEDLSDAGSLMKGFGKKKTDGGSDAEVCGLFGHDLESALLTSNKGTGANNGPYYHTPNVERSTILK